MATLTYEHQRSLTEKLTITYTRQLAEVLLAHCAEEDLENLATDVENFLFDANGRLGVTRFPDIIRQQWLK